MSLSGTLQPVSSLTGSTLQVKVGKVLKDTSLFDISLVVGFLLGSLLATDGVVLGGSQTIGNVSFSSNGAGLEL